MKYRITAVLLCALMLLSFAACDVTTPPLPPPTEEVTGKQTEKETENMTEQITEPATEEETEEVVTDEAPVYYESVERDPLDPKTVDY